MVVSYKDYKYVYTGYKDYCKKHNIATEKKLTKEENIIHDHRFAYDFNNPKQHTHDYSFDFNNPNEHYHDYSFDFSQNPQPKNRTANSSTNYTNTYTKKPTDNKAKPMATTARSTSTAAKSTTSTTYTKQYTTPTAGRTTYTQYSTPTTRTTTINTINNTYNKNQTTKSIKAIMIIFFFFFIFPFIFAVLSAIFESYDTNYDYEDNYTYNENYTDINEEYYEYDQYTTATSAFCTALKNGNINNMSDRITYEEKIYNNGNYWQNIINGYPINYRSTISCIPYTNYDLSTYEISNLEDEFYDKYYERINITEAKDLRIRVTYYGYNNALTTRYHYVIVGRINNKWYFINAKDTEY